MSPRKVPRQIREQLVLAHAVSAEVKRKKKSCPERGLQAEPVALDEVLPPALYLDLIPWPAGP